MQSTQASSSVVPSVASWPIASIPRRIVRKVTAEHHSTINVEDDESFHDVIKLAANVCGTPAAMLSFIHRGRQWLSARIGIGAQEYPRALFFCAHANRAPDQVMVVPDVAKDPRFDGGCGKPGGAPFRFYAGAPLVAPQGVAFGTLSVIDRSSRGLSDSQATALRSLSRQIVRQFALGQENVALRRDNAKLAEISMTDALTCIANRRAFNERLDAELAHARRTGDTVSLLLMDVDHFKRFNDTHGHLAGDEILLRIAETLKSKNRSYDLLARYGGEEFALILPQTRIEAAVAVAERLRAAVEAAELPRQPVTLSVGAAAYDPGSEAGGLVAAADRALYAAKAAGRNRVAVAAEEGIQTEINL